jgi:hypothetical protein
MVATVLGQATSWGIILGITQSGLPRGKSGRSAVPIHQERPGGYIDRASEFHDGLLEIAVSNGRYVDRAGKIVLDKGRYRGWDFSEWLNKLRHIQHTPLARRKDSPLDTPQPGQHVVV